MANLAFSDKEFQRIADLMYEAVGLSYNESKKSLIHSRLSPRILKVGLGSFADYIALLEDESEAAEFQMAVDLLTTNETYFFREPKHYDVLEAALNGQALPPRFSDFMKENFPKDLAGARKAFNDLPVVKALDAAGIHTFMDDYQDLYGPDRAAYVERAAKSVGVTFAVLKNGEWHEKGHMGWFGCVSGEKKEEDWEAAFWKLLEDVPDTELLTVVDVHI